jgi:hypothetical protein
MESGVRVVASMAAMMFAIATLAVTAIEPPSKAGVISRAQNNQLEPKITQFELKYADLKPH